MQLLIEWVWVVIPFLPWYQFHEPEICLDSAAVTLSFCCPQSRWHIFWILPLGLQGERGFFRHLGRQMPWGECKGEIWTVQFRLYSADVWQPARCWHANETLPLTLKAAICKIIIVITRMMLTDVYVVLFNQTARSTEQPVLTGALSSPHWNAATSGLGSGYLSKEPQKNTNHQAGFI